MRRLHLVSVLLGVPAIVACSAADPQGRSAGASAGRAIEARVTSISDGDTLRARATGGDRQEYRVRLIGIDSPETNRPNTPVQCGAREASAYMGRITRVGARVTLRTDPTQDTLDRFDRLLAYVTPKGATRTLQERMVAAGWAEVYVYDDTPFRLVRRFRAAQSEAKKAGRGVWGSCGGDFHSDG